MQFLEINADMLRDAIGSWSGDWEVESLKVILDTGDFGNASDRLSKPTYYGIESHGSLIATVQVAMHGDGKSKTIKLIDILIRNGSSEQDQLKVLVCSVTGLINLSGKIVDGGGNVRAIKIYGRTDMLLGGLRILAKDLSDAFGKVGIILSMEDRWLTFSS